MLKETVTTVEYIIEKDDALDLLDEIDKNIEIYDEFASFIDICTEKQIRIVSCDISEELEDFLMRQSPEEISW